LEEFEFHGGWRRGEAKVGAAELFAWGERDGIGGIGGQDGDTFRDGRQVDFHDVVTRPQIIELVVSVRPGDGGGN